MNRLSNILEDTEVRLANWRRAADAELLTLTGDEYARKKEDFEKHKRQSEVIQGKIRENIKVRLQMSKPGSRLGHGQQGVATNT